MRTEDMSPRFADLDAWPSLEAVHAMFEGQLAAVAAVRAALPAIAAAGEAAAARLAGEGRLVYAGAGTSARIAVQDGAELSPTFDWPEENVVFAIAGGVQALGSSAECAEDDRDAARRTLAELAITDLDVVVGVAASGATPYTVEFLLGARARGALTIAVANNPGAPLLQAVDHPILVDTGPEVLAGSTRMKAGTAQKVVLNLLSTLIMIRLGRVYRGLMVDMRARNAKLLHRAAAMVGRIAPCDDGSALRALEAAGGKIKLAVLLAKGLDLATAEALMRESRGHLRQALARREG